MVKTTIMIIFIGLLFLTEVASYSYDSNAGISTQLGFLTDGLLARMRRHPTRSTSKTLSAEEVAGVKDALRRMMPNRHLEDLVISTITYGVDEETTTRTSVAEEGLKIVIDSVYEGDPSTTTDTNTGDDGKNSSLRAQTKMGDSNLDYEYEDSDNKTIDGTLGPTRTSELNLTDNELVALKQGDEASTNTTTTPTTTKRTRRSKTTAMRIDIAKLMALVSNLTISYQAELALLLNKSLEQYTIPTCPTPTSTETSAAPTTTDMYGNLTGTIMGKCFVCGLEDKEMPRNAHCSDAFAGDFIPLVPMNPQAKAHIAKYRKYCRWMNIPRFFINASEPRSMWGRWTGGCSVRWLDVSGVYTQRTCRNRHRATMGKHWVSKRMAKLEMALQHVDNGCIISPMASLVPLSRGISMYARFHACVCTGNWCNDALRLHWKWSQFAWTIIVVLRYLT